VEKGTGSFVMVTEADLYNYPGLWLKGTGGPQLSATNPPFPKSLTNSGDAYGQGQVAGVYDYIAKVKGSRNYPWRIIAIAADEKELISNNLVWLLASFFD
jgi:alpha-glucosidase